jgi:hypothetical protein
LKSHIIQISSLNEMATWPYLVYGSVALKSFSKDKSPGPLGPGNYTPQFPNDLVSDLDFIKYRKTDASAPQDIIRLQNYANYQSVCLAQNLDDIAQDVIKTKTHLNGLRAELDHMENNQGAILMKLDQLITKMETLENAVQELQASLKQEQETASPVLVPDPSNDASFSFLGTSTSSDEPMKFLTLKQLAISLPNPTLARISEVAQLASDKLQLVQSQITELETEILASRTDQLAIVHSPNPTIKALGGDSQPECKPATDIPDSSKKRNPFSAWEAWINARYTSNKKAPMDVDGEPKVSLKNTESHKHLFQRTSRLISLRMITMVNTLIVLSVKT